MDRRCCDRRVGLDVPVQLIAVGGTRFSGRATDVSIGGVRVETETPAPVGATMVVRLRLPGSMRDLALPATVRWTRQGLVGFQFGLLGVRETHVIASFALERTAHASSEP